MLTHAMSLFLMTEIKRILLGLWMKKYYRRCWIKEIRICHRKQHPFTCGMNTISVIMINDSVLEPNFMSPQLELCNNNIWPVYDFNCFKVVWIHEIISYKFDPYFQSDDIGWGTKHSIIMDKMLNDIYHIAHVKSQ